MVHLMLGRTQNGATAMLGVQVPLRLFAWGRFSIFGSLHGVVLRKFFPAGGAMPLACTSS
jgi:hypothetical protein